MSRKKVLEDREVIRDYNIIYSCEHYGECPTPHYTGECNPECLKRWKKIYEDDRK